MNLNKDVVLSFFLTLNFFFTAATKALAHLAFDDDNKKTFVSDTQTDVVTTLFDLARSSRYPDVRESAKGVLWTLSEQLHSSTKYADLGSLLWKKPWLGVLVF